MLYYLFEYLEQEFQLPGASLFQFISGMGYRKMMEFVKKIQMYEQKLTM